MRNRQEQVKTLENEVSELDTQIQSYTSVAPQSGDEDVFTARSTQTVTGPGVQITLSDAPPGEIPEGATPNDLVIHQQDIEDTMNALWSGGAEAMTVQAFASPRAPSSAASATSSSWTEPASPRHM